MPSARRLPRWVITLLLPVVLTASLVPARAQQCASTDYTYQFVNWCTQPVWLAERSGGDPTAYPPQSGNWAMAGLCAGNADCPTGVCDSDGGRCTCATSADCPGSATCEADGKCGNQATVCVPQDWSSGTFWPRTGCTLDDSVSPATLTCDTGACFNASGTALLDCSSGNGGGSPTNPVTQFEVTSTASAINYDVSLAAGFNVELRAAPQGGGQPIAATTDTAACQDAGCTADLNATCPAPLQVTESGVVIGCLDPCTQCLRNDPAALQCDDTLGSQWTSCGGDTGSTTYRDLYCAENTADGNAQASANAGTPTASSQADCPALTTYVIPTFASDYTLPSGTGFCVFATPPQSTSGLQNYSWADEGTGTTLDCGTLADGTACGGYRTSQGGSYYENGLGYTCQTATFSVAGGASQTAHVCAPPTAGGIGTCTETLAGTLPLYSSTAGLSNPDWITASTVAGGGTTPYYVAFEAACPWAYAWQYDDAAAGLGCQVAMETSTGGAFTGFDVSFCGSNIEPDIALPDAYAALAVKGRAAGIARPGSGKLRVRGTMPLPAGVALADVTITLEDLLDEVGATGELVDVGGTTIPLGSAPVKVTKKKAVFETPAGVEPRLKLVLKRKKAGDDRVTVALGASGATIARPSGCTSGDEVLLETSLDVGAGGSVTRIGTIARWRCGKKALRGG